VLKELHVCDYAVIDELRLELGEGLNVLSGETGAGKSIVVGALSLLLGERASSGVVRSGRERALIEGVFDVGQLPEVVRRCEEAGIAVEDGWLILRREVQREGRNRAWVNASPATASFVREIGAELVDLHGQHEHQTLLGRAAQLAILDAYAGSARLTERVGSAHEAAVAARRAVEDARRAVAEIRERADYLRFKAEEIEAAELKADEEVSLEAEARRLEHSEELLALSGSLYDTVYGSEESVVDRLGALRRKLNELTAIDPAAGELERLFDTARHSLEEAGRELQRYNEGVSHDPGRLELLRQRQDQLFRLKSKYDGTIAEVIATGSSARTELDRLESGEFEIDGLEQSRIAAEDKLAAVAAELSAARQRAARRLGKRVSDALPDLGMRAGLFEVMLERLEPIGPTGAERAEYRVRLNAGFEPQPLARVASGGELSRVMLALKTELAAVDRVPSLVFDEIDAGIGGQVAHQVADRLAEVAKKHQVFAITHLPQIAARARTHWRVDKATSGGTSAARVERLEGEARVQEVARMLGGDPDSGLSRKHAEEMLGQVARAAKRTGAR